MSKTNSIFQKIKGFCRRNAYALIVSFCVLVVFSVVTAVSVADIYEPEAVNTNISQDQEAVVTPTGGSDVVVFDCPVKDGTMSKDYAEDHIVEDKTSGMWKTHQGIDYSSAEGTKVYAAYDGTVEKVETSLMDGTVITIKHSNNLKTIYRSLSNDVSVNEGDRVKKGDEIGAMGTSTNEKADGAHLHFEVMLDDKLVDPNDYLSSGK